MKVSIFLIWRYVAKSRVFSLCSVILDNSSSTFVVSNPRKYSNSSNELIYRISLKRESAEFKCSYICFNECFLISLSISFTEIIPGMLAPAPILFFIMYIQKKQYLRYKYIKFIYIYRKLKILPIKTYKQSLPMVHIVQIWCIFCPSWYLYFPIVLTQIVHVPAKVYLNRSLKMLGHQGKIWT